MMPATVRDVGSDIDARIADLLLTNGVVWAYSGKNPRACWLYDENTQREIKSTQDAGLSGLDATACGCVVRIDLRNLTQVNPVTSAKRRVRRLFADTSEIRGIAGMPRKSTPPNNMSASFAVAAPGPAVAALPITARASTETLCGYRARILAAFYVAGNAPRLPGQGKVAFNRRVKAWAEGVLLFRAN